MADLPPHADFTTEDGRAQYSDSELVVDNQRPTISDFGREVYSVLLEARRDEHGIRFFCEDCKTVNYRLFVSLTDCHAFPCKAGADAICDYANNVAMYVKNGAANVNIQPLVGVTCIPPDTRPGNLVLIRKDALEAYSYKLREHLSLANSESTDTEGIIRLVSMDCIDLRTQCSDPDILTCFLKHVNLCTSTYGLTGTCTSLDQNAISLGIQRLRKDPIQILHWHLKAYLWASEIAANSFMTCHLSRAIDLVDILYFQPTPPQNFQFSETAFSITNRNYLLNSIEIVYQQTCQRDDAMRKLLAITYAHFVRMYGFDTVPDLRKKVMEMLVQFPEFGADVMLGGFVLSAETVWDAEKLRKRVLGASYSGVRRN